MQSSGRSANDHSFPNWLGGLWMNKASNTTHVELTPGKVMNNFIHAWNLQHQRPTRLFQAELGIVGLLKSIQHHRKAELPQILPSIFHDLHSSVNVFGTVEETPHAPGSTFGAKPHMFRSLTNKSFEQFLSMTTLFQITLRQSKTLCTTAKLIDLISQYTIIRTHDLEKIQFLAGFWKQLSLMIHLTQFFPHLLDESLTLSMVVLTLSFGEEIIITVRIFVRSYRCQQSISLVWPQISQFSVLTCIFLKCWTISFMVCSIAIIRVFSCLDSWRM